ncbi:MAG: BlaI/MecI/CopY family transcriptional regulator [Clostridia bacterium]|nr:BlaI/MecI/CopY family transcriptional regulator [Clostridia bacterium]
MKRLPDTEFDVMKVIWNNPSPITTNVLMEKIGNEREWPVPALITMLNRLIEKGYIYSEKKGKMRYYYPIVKKQEYLEFVTHEFMDKYHGGSFTSFFATFYDVRMVSDETLISFVEWVKCRRSEFRRYTPDKK